MRKILLFFFFFPLLIKGVSQTNVFNPDERIGDTITVIGRVYAGNYLKNVITKPTFLNVFDSNPGRMLMLRIDSGDRKKFAVAPEKYYLNKKVTVRGVLGDYKGVALLRIVDSTAMVIDINDKGPDPIVSTGTYMSGQDFGFGKSDSLFRTRQDSIKKILDADPARAKKQVPEKQALPESPIPAHAAPEKQEADTVRQTPEVTAAKPGEEEVKPVEPKPIEKEKPTEPKPVEEVKPAERTEPAEEQKSAEPKSVEESKPTAESKSVEKTKPAEEPRPVVEPETVNDNGPDQVRRIRLKNLPVYKAPTPKPAADTSARAVWLKTISSQEFQPVNDTRIVETDEIEMRSAPTSDAPVIAYIMNQMSVLITYKSDKWSYLTVENPDGSTGMSGFIKNKAYRHLRKK